MKQSAVSAIFRLNPKYLTNEILQQAKQNYKQIQGTEKPQESITHYKLIKQMLSDLNLEKPDSVELLFVQRTTNPKDRHSGQIAFPGGHLDGEENDFQAACREVQEEIGIDLLETNHPDFYQYYLGKLPQMIFARKNNNGQDLYVNTHFFFIVQKQEEFKYKLSEQELQALKFIQFSHFIYPEKSHLMLLKSGGPKYVSQFLPPFLRQVLQRPIIQHFEYGQFPAINIGMGQPLWGLTYSMLVQSFQMLLVANKKLKMKYNLQELSSLVKTPLMKIVWNPQFKFGNLFEGIITKYNKRYTSVTYSPYQKMQSDYTKVYLALSIVAASYFLPKPSI